MSATMLPACRVQLLGTPLLECDGQPLELPRRKALALLAYLVTTRQRHGRDTLAALFWPEDDSTTARASLRRTLATLNETPLSRHLDANRDTIGLYEQNDLWCDLDSFNRLISLPDNPQAWEEAAALYRDAFMSGFSLRDAPDFDTWQTRHGQNFHQKMLVTLQRLTDYYLKTGQFDRSLIFAQRWTALDQLHEDAQRTLMRSLAGNGQRSAALAQFERYKTLLAEELGIDPEPETIQLYNTLQENQAALRRYTGILPPYPSLVIGRDGILADLRKRLLVETAGAAQIVLQGWPGIGKTTMSALLAHDPILQDSFPDGVLWTSLGQTPNLVRELSTWGRELGITDVNAFQTVEALTFRLTGALRGKRVLLIVDDVWEAPHALPFKIGSAEAALVFTTRFNDVSRALADTPTQIYKIPVLTEPESIELVGRLAPEVVERYPAEVRELIHDLEGLPLALQVAGRLLHVEAEFGWSIRELLHELRAGARLLAETAPNDRYNVATQTTPTIAALLQQSIDRLSPPLRECFALLGVFAPKPAVFSMEAMRAVWNDAIPQREAVRALVDRGLLEPAASGNFQMHALLVMQARSLFEV